MSVSGKPPPYPDRDSAPYWAALAEEGELRLQVCTGCGAWRWPPRALCNRCFGFDAEWRAVSGGATVVSWAVTHQVFAPAWREDVPYTTVQVRLAEQDDVLLIGGWLGDRAPRAGEAVRLEVVPGPDGFALPCWRP